MNWSVSLTHPAWPEPNMMGQTLNRQILLVLLLFLATCILPGQVIAVALGRVKVTSHLNEPFSAEIPVMLPQKGKKIPFLSVDIASPGDYHILGVYYQPLLRDLFLNMVHDTRGFRAVVTSRDRIESSFFNLILKVNEKHATVFKKYAIFLDLQVHAIASTSSGQSFITSPEQKKNKGLVFVDPVSSHPVARQTSTESSLKWARLKRYGPIVYGDTLYNVAWRMRAAHSPYTLRQVMVALFRKNTEKFISGNMNMMMPGVYLDAPAADEVAITTYPQAKEIIAEHLKRWKKKRQYQQGLKAQNTRYSTYVHIAQRKSINKRSATRNPPVISTPPVSVDTIIQHKPEKERLAQQLQQANAKIRALTIKLSTESSAAAKEHIKKLELRLARVAATLDNTRQTISQNTGMTGFTGLLYLLSGLVLILLAIVFYLLQRKPVVQPVYSPSDDVAVDTHDVSGQQSSDVSASQETGSLQDEIKKEVSQEDVDVENNTDVASSPAKLSFSEVDVYMRYGMMDEAQRHLEMLLEQDSSHVEAHCRLIELLASLDAKEDMDAAIAAGRLALEGNDLDRFEKLIQTFNSHHADVDRSHNDVEILSSGVDSSDMLSLAEDKDDSGGLDFTLNDEDQEPVPQNIVNRSENDEENTSSGIELDISDLEIPRLSSSPVELDVEVEVKKEIDGMSVDDEMSQLLDEMGMALDDHQDKLLEKSSGDGQKAVLPEDTAVEDALSDDFNVTSELDHLLDELDIDTARSLLAAGSLEGAETKFNAAMTGRSRCQALLGLADIAKKRGEMETMEGFLSEAVSLLDNEQDQVWFDQLKAKL